MKIIYIFFLIFLTAPVFIYGSRKNNITIYQIFDAEINYLPKNYTKMSNESVYFILMQCLFIFDSILAIFSGCLDPIPDVSCFLKDTTYDLEIYQLSINENRNKTFLTSFLYHNNPNNCKYSYLKSTPVIFDNTMRALVNLKKQVIKTINEKKNLKIVIGDGSEFNYKEINKFDEWISTDRNSLDIRCQYEVLGIIPEGSVYRLHMNHVFEHLYHYEIVTTIININKILMIGGELYLAVPDYYHPVKIS